jgi:comEA protein
MEEESVNSLLAPPSFWQYLSSWFINGQWRRHLLAICAGLTIIGAAVSFFIRPAGSTSKAILPTFASTTSLAQQVVVDVGGAVANPGVYKLHNNSRVIDALRAAGDIVAGADLSQINRAALVRDGDRIYVPRVGESAPATVVAGGGSAASALVNVNTATAEQLDSLPGVGPATAQAIISYRTEHGRFTSVTDLQKVSGIGPAKFAKMKDLVRV